MSLLITHFNSNNKGVQKQRDKSYCNKLLYIYMYEANQQRTENFEHEHATGHPDVCAVLTVTNAK